MDEFFEALFSEERSNEGLLDLISMLEPIIAENYQNQQGRGSFFFRYPVRLDRDGIEYEAKGGRVPNLTLEDLESLRYVTGANSLYIGRALLLALKFIEYRYIGDVNFEELERKYRSGYYKDKQKLVTEKRFNDMLYRNIEVDSLFE